MAEFPAKWETGLEEAAKIPISRRKKIAKHLDWLPPPANIRTNGKMFSTFI